MKFIKCPNCNHIILPTGESLLTPTGNRQEWDCDECGLHLETVAPLTTTAEKKAQWVDFLFEGEESGEFLVELNFSQYGDFAEALAAAKDIARTVDDNPGFCRMLTVEEAENTGLDTY